MAIPDNEFEEKYKNYKIELSNCPICEKFSLNAIIKEKTIDIPKGAKLKTLVCSECESTYRICEDTLNLDF